MISFFSSEIKKLNDLYSRPSFSFLFLYGRFDTGKTSLIREFCRDKKTLYFCARETAPQQQLDAFWQETVRCLHPAPIPPRFADWKQAFSYLAGYSSGHRIVLVLDEFHLLSLNDPSFAEAFQHAAEQELQTGKIFLITATSHLPYAQSVMKHPEETIFQHLSARACLSSVPFYTCAPLFASKPPAEQLLLYGVTGGLPAYLKQLDSQKTAHENIEALFFHSDSPMLVNPLASLYRELREISTYNFLLEIMAQGYSRLADIAAKASMGTNKCAKYLGILLSLGIVRREFPAIGQNSKKVRYLFADHMLLFWYRFVYPNLSSILIGNGTEVFQKTVLPALNSYLLPVFETVCAEYLERLASTGQTPFIYRHTGSWWTGGTKKEPFFRIPLVALDSAHAVLGICHCSDEPADTDCLEQLLAPLAPFGKLTRYCCIFSVSGFTPQLERAAASAPNVWLISLEDMI